MSNNNVNAAQAKEFVAQKIIGTAGLEGGEEFHQLTILDLAREFHEKDNLAKTIEHLVKHIELVEGLSIPIIGIGGTLNSGKTTMTASFLSEKGRQRTLIGVGDAGKATNRFTLWMPSLWKNNKKLLDTLVQTISNIFGCNPEYLSEDPQEARLQQNANGKQSIAEEISTLLLAFDESLDERGIAFLDCPDIQRSANTGTTDPTAPIRHDALKKGTHLCSAFLVVTTEEQLEAEAVGKIFQILDETASQLTLALAINKIAPGRDPEQARRIASQVANRWGQKTRVQWFGGAEYQFLTEASQQARPEFTVLGDGPRTLPDFATTLADQPLRERAIASALDEFQEKVRNVRSNAEKFHDYQRQCADALRAEFRSYLESEYFDNEGNPRMLLYKDFGTKIHESIYNTAPDYIKPSLIIGKKVESVLTSLKKLIPVVAERVKNAADAMAKSTQDALARILRGKKFLPPETSQNMIEEVQFEAQKALENHHSKSNNNFISNLDRIHTNAWKEMTMTKKVWKASAGPLVALGGIAAVLVIPFDWGHSLIAMASAKELLTAAGLGLATQAGASQALAKDLEKMMNLVAIHQISNLYALLCDAAGLPRDGEKIVLHPSGKNKSISMPTPDVPHISPAQILLGEPWLEIDSKAFDEIENQIS